MVPLLKSSIMNLEQLIFTLMGRQLVLALFTSIVVYLGYYSLSKFCASRAAMEEIYPFIEHNKTIYNYFYDIHHNHSLFFGLWHFLVPKDQFCQKINILKKSSIRAITILNKTSLFPVTVM